MLRAISWCALQFSGERTILSLLAVCFYAGELSNLIQQTGWVARAVLIILFCFSLFSWALIFQKLSLFARLNRRTSVFLRSFHATRGLPEPKTMRSDGSPLEAVYAAGYRELTSQLMASK